MSSNVRWTALFVGTVGLMALLGGCSSNGPKAAPTAAACPSAPCTPCTPCTPCPTIVHRAPCASPSTARPTTRRIVRRAPTASIPAAASAPAAVPAVHEERVPSTAYARPGFRVYEDDGRLWVFEDGSESLQGFLDKGEPAKRVTRIGVGPDDKSIMSDDAATIDEYIAAARYGRDGFHTYLVDGRLWVFREGSKEHQQFLDIGEPAKRVTRIGSGPDELSIIAPDGETIDAYMSTWQ